MNHVISDSEYKELAKKSGFKVGVGWRGYQNSQKLSKMTKNALWRHPEPFLNFFDSHHRIGRQKLPPESTILFLSRNIDVFEKIHEIVP